MKADWSIGRMWVVGDKLTEAGQPELLPGLFRCDSGLFAFNSENRAIKVSPVKLFSDR